MADYAHGIINNGYVEDNIIRTGVSPEETEIQTNVDANGRGTQTKLDSFQNNGDDDVDNSIQTREGACCIHKKEADNKIVIEIKNDAEYSSTSYVMENTECSPEVDELNSNFGPNINSGLNMELNIGSNITTGLNLDPNVVGPKINSGFIDDEEVRYRFTGAVFRSFNGKSSKQSWNRNRRSLRSTRSPNKLKESAADLNRSQYSLVSCGELTPEAVQLWLSLPEEVKFDPALAAFRRLYEKEHGRERGGTAPKRLPLVNSAPHLNNNLHVVNEDVFSTEKGFDGQFDNGITRGVDDARNKKKSKLTKARHYTKMTLLLACWIFFTLVFLMYNEKEHLVRHSSVAPGETKNYTVNWSGDKLSALVKLSGPFLSENNEAKLNGSQLEKSHRVVLWLERSTLGEGEGVNNVEKGEPWTVVLQKDLQLDFNEGEPRSHVLRFPATTKSDQRQLKRRAAVEIKNQSETNETVKKNKTKELDSTKVFRSQSTHTHFSIAMEANALEIVPFTITYTLNPLEITEGVIYAALLLCGLYVLIIFEIINRTMAAVLLSTTSLAILALVGERPSVEEVVSWLDVETLLLLFSMMLLVAIMAETGMFDYLAVYTFEVTKGKLWPLITVLSVITAVLSTFLDNVTTVLLMTPVTIRLCELMELDPIPVLMSMVLYSNIGGTATPVGDPPNVIIASNKAVIQSGINFTNFTLHMSLGIVLVAIQTYFQFRFMFRDTNKLRLNIPRDIQGPKEGEGRTRSSADLGLSSSDSNLHEASTKEPLPTKLRRQISIWRRASDSLPHLSKDQLIVRERLERKISKLQMQLDAMIKESTKRACPKHTFQSTLDDLKGKYKIRDKVLLIKATVAITFVVIVFFLHSIPELNRVSLGWTALLGAILLLVLADREDLEPILHRVEWSTLLFFAALFVLMEALSKLGLIEFIGGVTQSIILSVPESARLAVALLLMLWVSGITSAFVDNIPLTTMMVRVVTALGSNPTLNLPMAPLIWALSFGACLGGNGTLIGASANVVCAGVAEQHGYKFTFMQFLKIGFPIMIGHLLVASVYLLVCHCAFTWH